MMSPGSSVINRDSLAISSATEKTRSEVDASCMVSPFSSSEKEISSGAPASSGVTSVGPQGADPSKTLPGIH